MSTTKFIKVAFFDMGDTLVGGERNWLPGAQQTLAKLREQGVRLGLISNTGQMSRTEILNLLPEDFDLSMFEDELVIFSSEAHVEKPDPEIFRLAIEKAHVPSGECLFCTEDPNHIKVAKEKAKMQTAKVRKPPDSDIGQLVKKLIARGLLPA